MVNVKT